MKDLIPLEDHSDERGSLVVASVGKEIPFPVKRCYILHAVPVGASRGAHAHRKTTRFAVSLSGSFTLESDDGRSKQSVRVPTGQGIILDTMVWHVLRDFTSDAMVLVLASELYDEGDYIRDYEQFLAETK